jgi:hypothetical protein
VGVDRRVEAREGDGYGRRGWGEGAGTALEFPALSAFLFIPHTHTPIVHLYVPAHPTVSFSIHSAIAFTLEVFAPEAPEGETEGAAEAGEAEGAAALLRAAPLVVAYTPGAGSDALPDFLRGEISFAASQLPLFLGKVIEALHPEPEPEAEAAPEAEAEGAAAPADAAMVMAEEGPESPGAAGSISLTFGGETVEIFGRTPAAARRTALMGPLATGPRLAAPATPAASAIGATPATNARSAARVARPISVAPTPAPAGARAPAPTPAAAASAARSTRTLRRCPSVLPGELALMLTAEAEAMGLVSPRGAARKAAMAVASPVAEAAAAGSAAVAEAEAAAPAAGGMDVEA